MQNIGRRGHQKCKQKQKRYPEKLKLGMSPVLPIITPKNLTNFNIYTNTDDIAKYYICCPNR